MLEPTCLCAIAAIADGQELMLLQFSTKDAFRRSVTAAVHGDLDADTEERS